ncbi:MAG: condensation domain-containing protein [Ornithinimicrobium sp.]
MRLTSVAHLDLPPGPVMAYAVEAGPDGEELPVSFDQRRHVGQGQRPGSWMAVCLRWPHALNADDLARAWLAVIARHGTLRTVFSRRQDQIVLHQVDITAGRWLVHPNTPNTPDTEEAPRASRDVLREVLDERCAPFARPSHALLVAGHDTDQPHVIIGLDHAHTDAWSLLVLARDLGVCVDDVSAGRPPGVMLPAADSFAQHSAALESMNPAPPDVRLRWSQIIAAGGGVMPTFPLPLGDLSYPVDEVVEVRDVFDPTELRRFEQGLRTRGLRMFPAALSVLTHVIGDMSGQPLRAVLPVHSRHDERWHASVGWFITNAVIESHDPDPATCSAAIREAISLGSYPLAPIMAAYGGMPASPGMFAVSWLDHRRLPVAIDPDLQAQHVSAVIRTDGVMIWFVVNDAGMHVRCRYPDTARARESVGSWLDAVCRGLHRFDTESADGTPDDQG